MYTREIKTFPPKNLYVNVYNSSIHNKQKVETTPMSINWSMDNQKWYIHKMEYYSVMKMSEVLIYATRCMKFENIVLNERNTHKEPLLLWVYKKCPELVNPLRQKLDWWYPVAEGEDLGVNGEWVLVGMRFPFWVTIML